MCFMHCPLTIHGSQALGCIAPGVSLALFLLVPPLAGAALEHRSLRREAWPTSLFSQMRKWFREEAVTHWSHLQGSLAHMGPEPALGG